jgi:hypothetical protein
MFSSVPYMPHGLKLASSAALQITRQYCIPKLQVLEPMLNWLRREPHYLLPNPQKDYPLHQISYFVPVTNVEVHIGRRLSKTNTDHCKKYKVKVRSG